MNTPEPPPTSSLSQPALSEDLAYVAAALRRNEVDVTPLPIALYWAIYTAVGFALIDLVPEYCGAWFAVFGIAGGLFSAWMGKVYQHRSGVFDSSKGTVYVLHWGSILIGAVAIGGIMVARRLDPMIAAQAMVLLVGIVYFLAGAHFDRRYLPLGVVLVVGSVVTGFVSQGAWTVLGLLVAVGLVLLAVVPRRPIAGVRP
jgi:hypothetical protein